MIRNFFFFSLKKYVFNKLNFIQVLFAHFQQQQKTTKTWVPKKRSPNGSVLIVKKFGSKCLVLKFSIAKKRLIRGDNVDGAFFVEFA